MPGVRDDGSERLPSAVVDHWARRNASDGAAGRPGRSARGLLVWCGCVVLLVIGVAGLASTPYAWQRGDAMLRARTCTTEQVEAGLIDACFVPVPGRVTGRFRGVWRGLSFGVASLRSLLHRRVGRPDLTLVVSGLVALVLLGVDVAGALSWRGEALWWGALVAGVLAAPSRWVRSWAALAERRRG